jgi:hypothetical protein
MSTMLGREARRLAAVLHGDETRIIRLGLLTDPVVAAGLQALEPAISQPIDGAAAGRRSSTLAHPPDQGALSEAGSTDDRPGSAGR